MFWQPGYLQFTASFWFLGFGILGFGIFLGFGILGFGISSQRLGSLFTSGGVCL